MACVTPMKDLYQRLEDVGFDAKFVRYRVLPDWWADDLAAQPANRAMAEAAISRMLGFPVSRLRDPSAKLHLPPVNNVRLKRTRGIKAAEVRPALLLAEQVAKGVVSAIRGLPSFGGPMSAEGVRRQILGKHRATDLGSLLEFAWEQGIIVLHLAELPKASKRFSGMALFCDQVPVVILGFRSDSPPWLAFHLGHELGHILLGHVAPGRPPVADSDIDQLDRDTEEEEADRFACVVLTGRPRIQLAPERGLRAPKLVTKSLETARKYDVDPGTVALVYGRTADRMAVAQNALKLMGLDRGAHAKIGVALSRYLEQNDLPEATERLVSLLSAS